MKYVARPAARLVFLIFALAFSASPLRADELQDIDALVKQGQHAKALERVNQYLAQKPRDPKGRFIKGLILAEQNKGAEAIEVFTALSRDYPELPEPYNNLGDVYTKLASQAYDKALQFDSSNSAAKNKLSLIRDLISSNGPTRSSAAASGTSTGPTPPPSAARTAPAKSAGTKLAAGQAKSVATKPAEKPARAQGGGEEVLQTVLAWAGAWSKQNVESYLAFYAQDFKTPKGEARSEWEAARRQRISSPKRIEVAVESPKVTLKDQNNAVVSFRQTYRSDNLNIRSSKTLVMVRNEGRWLIQQERAGG